ncbi:mechanosensitive ion channel family protein [Halomicrococcus sp. SG-WS-1]|uniref:mechanosensitive ion channel family protein n=1 Tax=Halomicrococcus sp. SG-WS-1 TaxID=3439057 RepID=UPI003F7AFFDA
MAETLGAIVETSLRELQSGLVDALPRLVTAMLFVTVAYFGIKVALSVVRSALAGIYSDQDLVVGLFTTIVGVFLWFGAALTLLKILGMGEIAASLGTATGFLALGVSYALSNMIADTVAGVYLLRDPDFNVGDTVTAGGVTGTVRSIELRKTRLEVDGDVVVLGNGEVEGRWTRMTTRPETTRGDPERPDDVTPSE